MRGNTKEKRRDFILKYDIVLFLSDRVKAEMDLKELSETVQQQHQQQQGASAALPTPKRPIRSLDKTIESCKAQLGTFYTISLSYFFFLAQNSILVLYVSRYVAS